MSSEKLRQSSGDPWPPELYTRYSRHLILPEVGKAGQERLRRSSVAIVGLGGLGSPAAMYLAAAGVGRLGLFDFDTVDLTNLQRQTIHGVDEIDKPKVESAARRLADINPDVQVEAYNSRLTSANAPEALKPFDLVLDGCDNFPTRYLINDICVFQGKALAYGAIYRFHGQTSLLAGGGPCYRCLFPEPPEPDEVPSCAEGGVFGFLPGLIGVIQAAECVKALLEIGDPLRERLLLVDSLRASFREVRVARDPACPVCGENPTIREPIDYEEFCGLFEEDEAFDGIPEIEPEEAAKRLSDEPERIFLLDVRTPAEFAFASAPGAVNIPLADLGERLEEIDAQRERQVAVICRDGRRSRRACQLLHQAGFPDVAHVTGGMISWSRRVDGGTPRY